MLPRWPSFLTFKSKTEEQPELPQASPLYINRPGDKTITGDYHIKLDPTNDRANYVTLSTHEGDIDANLYLMGQAQKETLIKANSTVGDIFLTLVKRQSPVHITAVAENGSVRLVLPYDFDGLVAVTVSSVRDNLALGERLQSTASIHDSTRNDDSHVVFRVGPILGGRSLDRARIYAWNGEAVIDFVCERYLEAGGSGSMCSFECINCVHDKQVHAAALGGRQF